MKKRYTPAEASVILFGRNDIVTSSTPGGSDLPFDPTEPEEP